MIASFIYFAKKVAARNTQNIVAAIVDQEPYHRPMGIGGAYVAEGDESNSQRSEAFRGLPLVAVQRNVATLKASNSL